MFKKDILQSKQNDNYSPQLTPKEQGTFNDLKQKYETDEHSSYQETLKQLSQKMHTKVGNIRERAKQLGIASETIAPEISQRTSEAKNKKDYDAQVLSFSSIDKYIQHFEDQIIAQERLNFLTETYGDQGDQLNEKLTHISEQIAKQTDDLKTKAEEINININVKLLKENFALSLLEADVSSIENELNADVSSAENKHIEVLYNQAQALALLKTEIDKKYYTQKLKRAFGRRAEDSPSQWLVSIGTKLSEKVFGSHEIGIPTSEHESTKISNTSIITSSDSSVSAVSHSADYAVHKKEKTSDTNISSDGNDCYITTANVLDIDHDTINDFQNYIRRQIKAINEQPNDLKKITGYICLHELLQEIEPLHQTTQSILKRTKSPKELEEMKKLGNDIEKYIKDYELYDTSGTITYEPLIKIRNKMKRLMTQICRKTYPYKDDLYNGQAEAKTEQQYEYLIQNYGGDPNMPLDTNLDLISKNITKSTEDVKKAKTDSQKIEAFYNLALDTEISKLEETFGRDGDTVDERFASLSTKIFEKMEFFVYIAATIEKNVNIRTQKNNILKLGEHTLKESNHEQIKTLVEINESLNKPERKEVATKFDEMLQDLEKLEKTDPLSRGGNSITSRIDHIGTQIPTLRHHLFENKNNIEQLAHFNRQLRKNTNKAEKVSLYTDILNLYKLGQLEEMYPHKNKLDNTKFEDRLNSIAPQIAAEAMQLSQLAKNRAHEPAIEQLEQLPEALWRSQSASDKLSRCLEIASIGPSMEKEAATLQMLETTYEINDSLDKKTSRNERLRHLQDKMSQKKDWVLLEAKSFNGQDTAWIQQNEQKSSSELLRYLEDTYYPINALADEQEKWKTIIQKMDSKVRNIEKFVNTSKMLKLSTNFDSNTTMEFIENYNQEIIQVKGKNVITKTDMGNIFHINAKVTDSLAQLIIDFAKKFDNSMKNLSKQNWTQNAQTLESLGLQLKTIQQILTYWPYTPFKFRALNSTLTYFS